ncbi:hypothetical protein CPB85DRAFT_1259011 [Mucidula mucida]|nr:hypothetical protein CPB85DRAFT_1259011 [Mucidula mucida]
MRQYKPKTLQDIFYPILISSTRDQRSGHRARHVIVGENALKVSLWGHGGLGTLIGLSRASRHEIDSSSCVVQQLSSAKVARNFQATLNLDAFDVRIALAIVESRLNPRRNVWLVFRIWHEAQREMSKKGVNDTTREYRPKRPRVSERVRRFQRVHTGASASTCPDKRRSVLNSGRRGTPHPVQSFRDFAYIDPLRSCCDCHANKKGAVIAHKKEYWEPVVGLDLRYPKSEKSHDVLTAPENLTSRLKAKSYRYIIDRIPFVLFSTPADHAAPAKAHGEWERTVVTVKTSLPGQESLHSTGDEVLSTTSKEDGEANNCFSYSTLFVGASGEYVNDWRKQISRITLRRLVLQPQRKQKEMRISVRKSHAAGEEVTFIDREPEPGTDYNFNTNPEPLMTSINIATGVHPPPDSKENWRPKTKFARFTTRREGIPEAHNLLVSSMACPTNLLKRQKSQSREIKKDPTKRRGPKKLKPDAELTAEDHRKRTGTCEKQFMCPLLKPPKHKAKKKQKNAIRA